MRMRSERGRVESQTRASNATRGGFASVEIEEFEELPFLFFFSFLFLSFLSFSFEPFVLSRFHWRIKTLERQN